MLRSNLFHDEIFVAQLSGQGHSRHCPANGTHAVDYYYNTRRTLMQIELTPDVARYVISVSGEVDLATSPELDSAVIAALESGAQGLAVDLSDVTFMDSSGLGVIVRGLKRCREADIELDLVITNERVLKVFGITGLDQVIPIHDALEDI
jgi:anti-sigma B factor antagonist